MVTVIQMDQSQGAYPYCLSAMCILTQSHIMQYSEWFLVLYCLNYISNTFKCSVVGRLQYIQEMI